VMARVLAARGATALVFRGEDGLDELTTGASSRVWVVRDGAVSETSVHPEDVGLPVSGADALRGGDAAHNAEVARRFLAGEPGPVRDAVLLNAGAALVSLSLDDRPLADQLRDGIATAAEAVDSGAAARALDAWVSTSLALATAR
ncbi:MAG TPA: anthranilate phosphoribosyltransferase, partial [Actinomycetes bacterium]